MYLQKLSQPNHKNRRLYPRVRGRLTAEISQSGQERPILAIVTNLSQGGCYVETSGILLPGAQATLTFSFEHATDTLLSEVVRMDMGIGAALKFAEMNNENRAAVLRILERMATSEASAERQRSLNPAVGVKL
jgi:hypothetical protein